MKVISHELYEHNTGDFMWGLGDQALAALEICVPKTIFSVIRENHIIPTNR